MSSLILQTISSGFNFLYQVTLLKFASSLGENNFIYHYMILLSAVIAVSSILQPFSLRISKNQNIKRDEVNSMQIVLSFFIFFFLSVSLYSTGYSISLIIAVTLGFLCRCFTLHARNLQLNRENYKVNAYQNISFQVSRTLLICGLLYADNKESNVHYFLHLRRSRQHVVRANQSGTVGRYYYLVTYAIQGDDL